eukprot:858458_1
MDGNPEPSQQGHVCQAASNINDDPFTVKDIYAVAAEMNRKEDNMNRNVDFDTLSNAQLYVDGEFSRSTEHDATSNTLNSEAMNNELTVHEESIIEEFQTDRNKGNTDGRNIDDIAGDTVEVTDIDNATIENNDNQKPVENYQENPNKDLGMANRDEIEDADNTAAIQLVNTPVPGEQDIANTDDLIVKD